MDFATLHRFVHHQKPGFIRWCEADFVAPQIRSMTGLPWLSMGQLVGRGDAQVAREVHAGCSGLDMLRPKRDASPEL